MVVAVVGVILVYIHPRGGSSGIYLTCRGNCYIYCPCGGSSGVYLPCGGSCGGSSGGSAAARPRWPLLALDSLSPGC